jgi:Arc/MetJ family transcription regulator
MRTNIDIDDDLLATAMKAGGFRTKKETVEAALRQYAQQAEAHRKLRALRGKIAFVEGYDYKALRSGN